MERESKLTNALHRGITSLLALVPKIHTRGGSMEKLARPLRLMLIVSLLTWLGPASPATARDEDRRSNHTGHGTIRIDKATIQRGKVVVEGDHAKKRANIYWEDDPVPVTKSDRDGDFKFSTTNLPIDCVGKLSDGVSTIDVVIRGCTTQQVISGGGVLKTGQTTSYAGGDDGELQKGTARSYTDNGATITDNTTGLMWEKLKDDGTINDWDTTYTWADAFLVKIADLNSANFAGHNDWRLPNINELQTLVDYGRLDPAIDSVFNNGTGSFTQSSDYWSSTTFAIDTSGAWTVSFLFGNVSGVDKTTPFYVRAVRTATP